jgi:hypothetical protein
MATAKALFREPHGAMLPRGGRGGHRYKENAVMINTFVIDPRLQTITQAAYPTVTFREINHAIGSGTMDCGYRFPDSGDLLWVDDEGLLKSQTKGEACFEIDERLLFGRALLTGPEVNEEVISVVSPLAYVESLITWRGVKRLVRFERVTKKINHPIFGQTVAIINTPILEDV